MPEISRVARGSTSILAEANVNIVFNDLSDPETLVKKYLRPIVASHSVSKAGLKLTLYVRKLPRMGILRLFRASTAATIRNMVNVEFSLKKYPTSRLVYQGKGDIEEVTIEFKLRPVNTNRTSVTMNVTLGSSVMPEWVLNSLANDIITVFEGQAKKRFFELSKLQPAKEAVVEERPREEAPPERRPVEVKPAPMAPPEPPKPAAKPASLELDADIEKISRRLADPFYEGLIALDTQPLDVRMVTAEQSLEATIRKVVEKLKPGFYYIEVTPGNGEWKLNMVFQGIILLGAVLEKGGEKYVARDALKNAKPESGTYGFYISRLSPEIVSRLR